MKADIHPDYTTAVVTCSCGNRFETRSTSPELHVELCNECHPFFTGKQKLVDSGGRVERFRRRYGTTFGSQAGKAPPTKAPASSEKGAATDVPEAEAEAAPAEG